MQVFPGTLFTTRNGVEHYFKPQTCKNVIIEDLNDNEITEIGLL